MIYEDKPSLDDALAHFGVKGMKWGVRKKSAAAGVGVAAASLIVGATPIGAGILGGATVYAVGKTLQQRQKQRDLGAKYTSDLKKSGALDHPVAHIKKK